MGENKKYRPPIIEVINVECDAIRTSFGGGENELPFAPIE